MFVSEKENRMNLSKHLNEKILSRSYKYSCKYIVLNISYQGIILMVCKYIQNILL